MRRRLAIALAVSAVLAACGRGSTDQADASETTIETGTEPTAAAPTPAAETDFDALYREIEAIRKEAYTETDPAKLAQISNDKYAIAALQRDADAGTTRTRSQDYAHTVDEVTVFEIVNEDLVTLRVTDTETGETIKLDADGNETSRTGRDDDATRVDLVFMERTGSGDWKSQYRLGVAIDFPASSDGFVEQTTFPLGDKTISFRTTEFGSIRCWSLSTGNEPIFPSCFKLDGIRVRYYLSYNAEFEAASVSSNTTQPFSMTLDGEEMEFFSGQNTDAIKVSEVGTMAELVISVDGKSNTFDFAFRRDEEQQSREGILEPETDTTK